MIGEKLKWNDIQDTLKTVHSLGDSNRPVFFGDTLVILVANDDGLSFASRNLGKSRLDLGVQGVPSHDDNYREILVDESQGTVLQLSSKDTYSWPNTFK